MAVGPITQITDVIVPEIFTPYIQQRTQEKARLVQSGAAVASTALNALLQGGGLLFHMPSFKDLDSDVERVATDTASFEFTGGVATPSPMKIQTSLEVAARLNRNQSWSAAQLTEQLAGADPMAAIANRVSDYWVRRLQSAFIATMKGVFANNAAPPVGSEHVQNDLTVNISGSSFVDGVTTFSAEAFIDALTTMGDSSNNLGMLMVHSVVFSRMQKNNLIDFIPDARGEISVPTFLGRQVLVDDGTPRSGGVYESWLFGPGAIQLGVGTPPRATDVQHAPGAGNGNGQDILYSRVEWVIHPVGHAYVGTPPIGGPSNDATTNNLANASSFKRVYPERKQISIARLITRES